jgi:GT2 family glycosyltransferase
VGVNAKVTSEVYSGVYRVDRSISGLPSVNIIIPFKDKLEYLKACLYSIKQSTYKNFFVTLVDNLSEETKTIEFLNSIPEEYFPEWADSKESYLKTIVYSKPFNFSAINNYAVENSEPTDILLFLNNDTEVITTNWLEQMVQHAQNKEVGAVGAKLLYPNGSMQHAGVIIGIGGVAGHSHKHVFNRDPGYFCRPHLIQELSAVTGACLMVRNEVFKEVGGFEEDLPKAFNDVDLCLKIRGIGYKIIYTPYSILYHYESISRGLDNAMEADFQKAITYMLRKWNCLNFKDPYYNVNLSKTDEKFSVL